MIKHILLFVAVFALSACSLPSRGPVSPNSFMVNPVRSGAPL